MLFKDLFIDMLNVNIPDDIAVYFKAQVKEDLHQFVSLKEFVEDIEEVVNKRNVKNR